VADGSLLGLCRGHDGGGVDWDDDTDIMIPRADFERDPSGLRTKLRRSGLVLLEVVPNDMYKVLYSFIYCYSFICWCKYFSCCNDL
jgi:hypothetical protein